MSNWIRRDWRRAVCYTIVFSLDFTFVTWNVTRPAGKGQATRCRHTTTHKKKKRSGSGLYGDVKENKMIQKVISTTNSRQPRLNIFFFAAHPRTVGCRWDNENVRDVAKAWNA